MFSHHSEQISHLLNNSVTESSIELSSDSVWTAKNGIYFLKCFPHGIHACDFDLAPDSSHMREKIYHPDCLMSEV